MKTERLPPLEKELQNIFVNLCPAQSHDGEKYACFFTGENCKYQVDKRVECEDYRVHILPRRGK